MSRYLLSLAVLACTVSFATVLFAQAPPSDLHGMYANGTVRLQWSAPESSPAPGGYNVYRSANGMLPYNRIGTSATTSYEDAAVTLNRLYKYKVTALYNDTVESMPSNVVQVFTSDSLFLYPPRHLQAAFHDSTVSLSWNRPETDVNPTSYKIYRSAGFHMPGLLGSTPDTSYDDTAVSPNTLYNYAVTAVYRDTIESMPSNIEQVFTGTGDHRDSGFVKIEFTSTPPHTAIAHHAFVYDAQVSTSPAGVRVCFRLKDAPDGMTIDSATGIVSWTPDRPGCYEVEIVARACDTLHGYAEQEFPLYVLSGSPGSLAGTVQDSAGGGISHVNVKLFDVARGDFVLRTSTDDSGHYKFPIVNPSTYLVRAKPENRDYLPQWYKGAARIADATPVVVPESGAVRVDFTLQRRDSVRDRFQIAGTVMDAASAPVNGAKVVATPVGHDNWSGDLYDDWHEEFEHAASTVTDSSGHYLLTLHGGTYLIGAFAEHYLPQFWNHRPSPLEADPLHLAADTSGIDFNLQPRVLASGSISGHVLYAADSTAAESHVIAFRKDSTGHFTRYVNFTRTDSSGAYTLGHLPDGAYIVLAKAEHDIIPTFYNLAGGTPYLDSATAVSVSGGGAVAGIDMYVMTDSVDGLNNIGGAISLSTTSSSDGNVPLAGAIVTIAGSDGKVAGSAISQGDGTYLAAGLAPGTYTVLFQKPGSSSASVLASVAYQNNSPTTTIVNAQLGTGPSGPGVMSLRAQWNLVSVPVDVVDQHRTNVFPGSVSNAYRYTANGYQASDLLDYASGYWLKFAAVQVITLDGAVRTAQTIPVAAGWNLIGSISTPVSVASIQQSQQGMLSRNLFGYNGGYYIASTIDPGKGYWVKANAAGTITLAAGAAQQKASGFDAELKDFNSLTLSDEAGNAQTLYFGSGAIDIQSAELPPSGPEGIFDARFTSQRFVEIHPAQLAQTQSFPIHLQSAGSPVTARWTVKSSNVSYALAEQGRLIPMNGTGSAQLAANGPGYLTLSAGPNSAPKEFMLYQNYPNPFNPTTTIAFDLPQAAQVTLKVYNIIGQTVATLAEHVQYDAGRHALVLDASKLGSGLYFTRLQAGTYSSVRKMVLVK